MAKSAKEILDVCKACDKVPKDFPSDPMYQGGMLVFNDTASYPLTKVEIEIVSTSNRREQAGLGATLENTDLTDQNAHLVAIIFKAGLRKNGLWNSPSCCAPCHNRDEYNQLFPSDSKLE